MFYMYDTLFFLKFQLIFLILLLFFLGSDKLDSVILIREELLIQEEKNSKEMRYIYGKQS